MPRILAIDDKEDNLVVISAILKNMIEDCDVITSLSGPEGIEKVCTENPDVVLLDIKMPGMDGYEVCKILKSDERTKHIPVIMITAINPDTASRIRGLELGADAFLSKPIDEAELAAQVKVMLRIKTAEDQLRSERDLLEETVLERTRALQKSEAELRLLSSHLQNVREEERTSIAREIHDELGQSLTALKMEITWIIKNSKDGSDSIAKKTSSIISQIDGLIDSVRRISSNLRPGVLDDLGLCAAVRWQAGRIEQRSGIKCSITCVPEEFPAESSQATALYRVFQEAMTNIIRHSRATKADILLNQTADFIELQVDDNGRGISAREAGDEKSFGIIGMRERIHSCGGTFEIKGIPVKGTRIKAMIPLSKAGIGAV